MMNIPWYSIPTALSVLFVIYILWPEKKNHFDGEAVSMGIGMMFNAGSSLIRALIFLVIVLLSWVIAFMTRL